MVAALAELSCVCWVTRLDQHSQVGYMCMTWPVISRHLISLESLNYKYTKALEQHKVREKPPANVVYYKNRENEVCRGGGGGKIPTTCRECCAKEKVDHSWQYLYPG